MKRMLVLPLVMGLGAIALTACSINQPAPMPEPTNPSPSEEQATNPEPSDPTSNPWVTILGTPAETDPAGPDWKVEPCEGNAPFLCVYQGEKQVGTVEIQSWSLEQQAHLVEALEEVGLDPENLDLQEPAQQEQVTSALSLLVEDLYATVQQDWATGYGDTLTLVSDSPAAITVGGNPGVTYRFQGVQSDGTVQQKTLGYMAFDGEVLYIISTAAAFDEPPSFQTVNDLTAFEPVLTPLVANLQL